MKPDHRIINVYQGSTEESYLVVYKDGRIKQHTENDGWRYVNHGAEAHEKWITLEDVRKLGRRHGNAQTFVEQVEEAIRALNAKVQVLTDEEAEALAELDDPRGFYEKE